MTALCRVITSALGLSTLVAVGACDPPIDQKPKAGTTEESKVDQSSDAKSEKPTAIVSPDNPYQ
jgi:hypothetical protein